MICNEMFDQGDQSITLKWTTVVKQLNSTNNYIVNMNP
jgi:hypothetical protein